MVKIYDNSSQDTQLTKPIKNYLPTSREIKVATGYFYLSGYEEIKDKIPTTLGPNGFKILMGDETNIITAKELVKGYNYKQKIIEKTLAELSSIPTLERSKAILLIKNIQELYELIANGIIDVRIFTKGKFHVKLYLFIKDPAELEKPIGVEISGIGSALLGSSNFSKPGITQKGNVELNILLTEDETLYELNKWFEEKWNLAEEFNKDLLKIIKTQGLIGKKPEEILDNISDETLGLYLSPQEMFAYLAWNFLDGRTNLYEQKNVLVLFQEIGVLNAEAKLKQYYGVLVADSVGLGKSFIAGQIARNYLFGVPNGSGDYWNGKLAKKWLEDPTTINKGVLIIVPAHLQTQWRDNVLLEYFLNDCLIEYIDENNLVFKVIHKDGRLLGKIKLISYAKFSRIKEQDYLHQMSDDFDLIILDEAHRLRNGKNNNGWINVQELKKKNSYIFTPEDEEAIPDKIRNRFILLSATPLNNRIEDLLNMFKVFLDRDYRDLINLGKDISLFDQYSEIRKILKDQPRNLEYLNKLKLINQRIKSEILDDLILLRTRHYIKNNEDYKGIEINGRPLEFIDPKVKRIKYDEELEKWEYYESYTEIFDSLEEFLSDLEFPYIDLFSKSDDTKFIIRILMQILLLKRMESSIFSFDRSIHAIREKENYLMS
ncbi:MAG: SNF2-related protein, partial [Candidatus Hodarchaeota archaeon]